MNHHSDETALAEAVGVYTPEPVEHHAPGTRKELITYTIAITLLAIGLVTLLPYIPTV